MDNILVNPAISFYIGAFVQWGFLMAFLYSLVISINKPRKEAVWLSLVMTISYSSSLFIDIQDISYLQLFLFDITTIFAIIILRFFIIENLISIYLLLGLTINSSLFLGMYIDVSVFNNYEPWWFWSFYSISINVVDLSMIAIFFINKDFLGLDMANK
ncbi:membrane protein [Pseudoalteromonas sp. TB64]|uniref:membrane protein n=1 Tax=Pseudoalteromonas sp. TB64 TaxID=1938600 RepID=UPI000464FA8A|nr:membrane protein [Pseudoalteromonas sp. TB64]